MGESRRNGPVAEGVTLLMYACQQGHVAEVRHILSRKPSVVRERDRTGKTALHYCAENSNLNCVDQLLSVAGDSALIDVPDEDGYTALHLAVISGNNGLVRYLVNKGADLRAFDNEKHSPVHWATVCGELDCLATLIEVGADPSTADIHGAYPIHYAAQMCGSNTETNDGSRLGLAILRRLLHYGVNVNVTDQDGRQPLLWAASAGGSDAMLALVNAGANVSARDKDGLTALHCAASRGHNECLETLHALCGAELDAFDNNGCTALFYAITLGHADCTELLLKYGAQANRQDRKGRTPAHCGAAKGQLETLKILSKHGGNLWMKNIRGDLPLHEAIQSGRKDLVRWLLDQRPDAVNASNNDGRTPLHIAAVNGNVELCKVLMDRRADINPIMRNGKGQLMTPLDAALHRGRGSSCAKYLQLSGAVPASKLGDKSRANTDSSQFDGQTPDQDILSDNISRFLERSVPLTMSGSPQDDKAIQADLYRYPLKDQGSQTLNGVTSQQQQQRPDNRRAVVPSGGGGGTGVPLHHGPNTAKHNFVNGNGTGNRQVTNGSQSENVSPISGDTHKDSGISDSHTVTHSERGDYSDLDSDNHGGSEPGKVIATSPQPPRPPPRRRHRTARVTGGGGGGGGSRTHSNGTVSDSIDGQVVGHSDAIGSNKTNAAPMLPSSSSIQSNMRRYQRERRIFQVLLELNRLKIRGGWTSEQAVVKRLADNYVRERLVVNQQKFQGPFTLRAFEKYLYDQLRLMSTSGSGKLGHQSQGGVNLEEEGAVVVQSDPSKCTHRTYECHHAAHAYTGIPCAAFIKPKVPRDPFLPHILPAGKEGHAFDVKDLNPKEPVTVEIKQGRDKKLFTLPTDKLDKNKRYQVKTKFHHMPRVSQVTTM